MAITFNLELNNRPNKNKTYAVLLRVTQDKKHKRIKTGIAVNKKADFNKDAKQGNWIRQGEPNHKVWNDMLAKEIEKAKAIYTNLKEESIATKDNIISSMVEKEKTHSFIEYARQRTQEIYDIGSYRNWKKYRVFCRKFEAFMKSKRIKDISFNDIDTSLVAKFDTFLHSLPNENDPNKKLHPNTIQVNLNIFKSIIKRAIEVEKLMKPEKNPFLTYSYKGVKTVKEKLDETELNRIIELELEKDSMIWHSRNYFLFSLYCAGIRAGDLIQLRWCNITAEGRLIYQMGKNHKERDLILVEQAKDILAYYYPNKKSNTDYIFPLLDSKEVYASAITQKEKDILPMELRVKLFNHVSSKNTLINKYLKQVAVLAEIDKNLSLHISRHSFSRIAKQKGTDNAHLKNLLGHYSLKTTEVYMGNFDTHENDKALEAIFTKKEVKPEDDYIKWFKSLTDEQKMEIMKKQMG